MSALRSLSSSCAVALSRASPGHLACETALDVVVVGGSGAVSLSIAPRQHLACWMP
jgi:hypothetical protein